MKNKYNYVVLGAGKQGTAAAYDLGKNGDAERVALADKDINIARQACNRLNELLNTDIFQAKQINVDNSEALISLLDGKDAVISAVPYYYNLNITKAAIQAGCNYCDMGGHTDTVRSQLTMDKEAKNAGISIVPDCGMGPGLIVTMAVYVMDLFEEPREIYIYDGGLPQNPIPPWNYQATFHLNGLTNEMDGFAYYIRKGKVTPVPTLTEPEFIDIPPLGKLEADVTSGALSTSPWTFENKLQIYQNKTLRYPGHFEWWRAFKALGLFSEDPIKLNSHLITPREFFHTLLEPKIVSNEVVHDICLIRVKGIGIIKGKEQTIEMDLTDHYDEETGFTAMERLTGWHCSIMAIFQAKGKVAPGGIPMETAISPEVFMREFEKRGITYQINYK